MLIQQRWSHSADVVVRESMSGIMVSVRRSRTFVEWILRRQVSDRIAWWRAGDGRWFHYPSFELVEEPTLVVQLERMIGNDWVGGDVGLPEVIP